MKIILGVTGGIGAYKSALILRLLQEEGFEILPVMTRNARQFLTPLTLEKLSGNRVITDLFEDPSPRIEHIALARQSDLLLVAPATADILAKFAAGIADDFLSTLYLSTTTPVVVAPAMNVEMWHHPATQANLQVLRSRGVIVVEPGVGFQACGEVGEGRLAEPEEICRVVVELLQGSRPLEGKRVLVTAGPTEEALDEVRFISNRSSGKMGYAVAAEARKRGAAVVLVSGPTSLPPPAAVEVVRVRSAGEMAQEVLERAGETDILVMAAAVSDWRPARRFAGKVKKEEAELTLSLEPTPDILKELGRRRERPFLVGFAAEFGPVQEEARRKRQEKNLDLIVANDISLPDRGFGSDVNQVWLLDRWGREEQTPVLSKAEIARLLWDRIQEGLPRIQPAEKVRG